MKRLCLALIATMIWTSAGSTSTKPATPAELDTLLAPVALYPDQLLAQMLMCTANPGKVGTLAEWLRSQTLKGSELQAAAEKAGFEDSFVALAIFPDVVEWMAARPEWSAKIGPAFAADKTAVFGSIQRLRKKAKDAGTLKTTPQQSVETKQTSSGESVIVIEPANPQVVYVPQYNPQVVYTQPTTVVVQKDNSADAAVAGLIGFTAGIAIGAAVNNNYYYGYGWHGGAYMYNDAWDDYYDAREDAREDWQDHREDIADERGDRSKTAQENRTERSGTTQEQRTERTQSRTENRTGTGTTATTASQESRGFSKDSQSTRERSGTGSTAFSGYGSGKSERAASSRGKSSRGSSRSSGSRKR